MNGMGLISRPCCLSIMQGGLSEKAHSWISFRTAKSDLAPFPDVCCILLHPKHIAAVLKASNFVFHFVVAYRNIRPPITKELNLERLQIQIVDSWHMPIRDAYESLTYWSLLTSSQMLRPLIFSHSCPALHVFSVVASLVFVVNKVDIFIQCSNW